MVSKVGNFLIVFFFIFTLNGCSTPSNLVQESERSVQTNQDDGNLENSSNHATHLFRNAEKENCVLPKEVVHCSVLTHPKDIFGRIKNDHYYSTSVQIEELIKNAEIENRPHPQTLQHVDNEEESEITLKVMATAYNSLPGQTDKSSNRTAWGDTLAPDTKSIAVSHDLIKMGFTRGVEVKIEGLSGTYVVLDKMPKRWQKKIDIYMGKDLRKARNWGRRRVMISR